MKQSVFHIKLSNFFLVFFSCFVFVLLFGYASFSFFYQIIMPNTACENPSPLFKFLSDQIPYANLSSVQRKYFNEAKGNTFYILGQ